MYREDPMIDLKEKPTGRLNISRISHPVNEGTVTLRNYLNRSGDLACAPFWSSGALAYDTAGRLPAVYRPASPVIEIVPRPAAEDISQVDTTVPVNAPPSPSN